ncbi:MAG: DUF1080 domain-containing protein [Planctomycetaceae bacterium]
MPRRLVRLGVPVLVVLAMAAARAEEDAAEPAGMESLFNGKHLAGWDGDPRLWSVKEGVIHGETTKEHAADGNTFLIWQGGEVGDLEIHLSFAELMRLDDWNDVVIRAEGNRVRHWLNGRLILDFTDNDPKLALTKGVIALQLHAGAPMWAEFRDIRLKKLP